MFVNTKLKSNQVTIPSTFRLRLVRTKIIAIRKLTDETFVVSTDRNGMNFQPGQRVRINLKGDSINRKYSIYSGNEEANLEFLIREVPNGYLTPKLKPMNVGDEIEIVGPQGNFSLEKANWPGFKYLFIATGTGIAPFHCMVRSLPSLKYKLLHGVRYGIESYDQNHYENDKLIVCTSKDDRGHYNGRVTDYLKNELIENFDHVYLCGNNDMIQEAHEILASKGYSKEQIHTEVYF